MLQAVLSPISNKATWAQLVELRDVETNELIDLTGYDIMIEVRRRDDCGPFLTGSTDDGKVVIVDIGVFQFTFAASEMRGLCNDTYDVGIIATVSGETVQILLGTVPVLDGIVRAT